MVYRTLVSNVCTYLIPIYISFSPSQDLQTGPSTSSRPANFRPEVDDEKLSSDNENDTDNEIEDENDEITWSKTSHTGNKSETKGDCAMHRGYT